MALLMTSCHLVVYVEVMTKSVKCCAEYLTFVGYLSSEIFCFDKSLTYSSLDKVRITWRALVSTVMNFRVP